MKTPSQSLEMLQQLYGDNTLSHAHVFEWNKRFKVEREKVKDHFRGGRSSRSRADVNVEWIKHLACG